MITVMRDEFLRAARDFDRIEPFGKLHPNTVNLHVKQGGVSRRTIVIERIFHRSEEARLTSDQLEKTPLRRALVDPTQRFLA